MKTYNAKLELDIKTVLGEGPVWHAEHNSLYFVDIIGNLVYGYDLKSKKLKHWKFESFTSAVAKFKKDALLVTAGSKIVELNLNSNKRRTLTDLNLFKNLRCNEAKPDAQGRYWVGTMHVEGKIGSGAFYRIDKDGKIRKVLSNLSIPNGFCWSKSQKILYHIDSAESCIRCYEFDSETGDIQNGKTLYQFDSSQGLPDGMCMDVRGRLWIAFWGGFKIICFNPETKQEEAQIKVPCPNVTSCAFGGIDENILFITTAHYGLSKNEKLKFPKSGSVFSCKVDTHGYDCPSVRLQI